MSAMPVDDPFTQHNSWWRQASQVCEVFDCWWDAVVRVRVAVFCCQYELGLLRSPAGASSLATGMGQVSADCASFYRGQL